VIRLSVGLEDVRDLQADLGHALAQAFDRPSLHVAAA
jgi:cystathionine beta-lyase/cystathionine gamma-synthase